MPRRIARPLGVLAAFVLASAVPLAQESQRSTEVRNFEVVSVSGNTVVVKDQTGTEEITVPADFRFTVGNQRIPVQQLKPGMKGTATITTTTTVTPVHLTEVRNGEVIQVSANSMILKGPDGFKMYSAQDIEKRNARIFKDGQPIAFSQLAVGDRLTATIVTQGPPKVVTEREVQAALVQAPAAARTRPTASASATTPPPAAAIAVNASSTPAVASSAVTVATGAAVQAQPQTAEAHESPAVSPMSWLSWPVLWSVGALLTVLIVIVLASRARRPT
jgi:hypothetical protein